MPTDLEFVVTRINTACPWLLKANTHPACGEFLQRITQEPECKAERVGLLSKDDGENGYTYPNGIRCSHDVIAFPNGERVDVIQSAGAYTTPGGPTWQVIDEYDDNGNPQWRPHNKWVDVSTWPLYDSGTPHDAGAAGGVCEVGFGWFCMMTALAEWPDEAKANMDWILRECNPSFFRVMLCVEGESHATGGDPDVWTEAGVFIHKDWENRYRKMLEWFKSLGRQAHCTIYGGRNQTPTESDRQAFQSRIIAASDGYWDVIRSFEMANEYKVNKWTTEEVRAMGRDMRKKLPTGFRLSLSSPDAAHGGSGDMSNEVMEASFVELYGGADPAWPNRNPDCGAPNECTIHTMRDHGKWSDPYSYNFIMPALKKINNEPPGPGSSAGGMYTTAADVDKDLNDTIGAGWVAYVAHSEWCVWNGHLPSVYYNGWREIKECAKQPNMPEIAPILFAASDAEVPDYGPPPRTDQLLSGQQLVAGQQLVSPGKTCQALFDRDCNFVVYTSDGTPVWASQTAGHEPGSVQMNEDGNLVVYDAGGVPCWASHTEGNPGAIAQLQDDNVLVIYADPAGDKAGTPLWSSAA